MVEWLTRWARPSASDNTNQLAQKRKDQIHSLREAFPRIFEVRPDLEYRLAVNVGAAMISLNIFLPPDFPTTKPVVNVSPPLNHIWVNQNMNITGCQDLNQFSVHTSLGRVVQTIVNEFQRNPPLILDHAFSKPTDAIPPSYGSVTAAGGSAVPVRDSGNGANSSSSIISSRLRLSELSTAELHEFLDNEDILNQKITELEESRSFQSTKSALCEENEALARYNLSLEPSIEQEKENLREKLFQLEQLVSNYDSMKEQFDTLSRAYSHQTVTDHLQVAALEAEEESDKIAQNFVDRKMDVESFIQNFTDSKRKLYHLRRTKEERLTHDMPHF